MSNSRSRRPRPSAAFLRAVRPWQCPDCSSETGRPWRGPDGLWHLPIAHDDKCPALAGVTSLPIAFIYLQRSATP